MNRDLTQLTDREKRLLRIAKALDSGPEGIIEYVAKLEETIEEAIENMPNLENVLKAVKGKDGDSIRGEPGLNGYTPIKGVDYVDGQNYVITDDDIKEIAKKVKVPVLTQIIEKTETIREIPVPVVTEKVIEIVTEKVLDDAMIEKIEELSKKIESIDTTRRPLIGGGSRPIKVLNNGTEVSGNVLELNFANATSISTVGRVGRRVTITTGGGGFTRIYSSTPVNGSQDTFTFAQLPSLIHKDGLFYEAIDQRGNENWSWDGSSVTLSSALGPPQYGFFGVVLS